MASSKVDGPAIGIDLGTTYSCVAVWRALHQRVEVIANDQGSRTTPSCVAFTESWRLVGDAAMNQAAMNPVNTVFGECSCSFQRQFFTRLSFSDSWRFESVASPICSELQIPAIFFFFRPVVKCLVHYYLYGVLTAA
jgi:hypothetical protein